MTPEQQLRDVALRVTGPRVAVLTEVHDHPHADVDTLTAKVRARLGSVSTQAVYDVLRALTDAGLVRRIELPRSLRGSRRRQPPTTSYAARAARSRTSTARPGRLRAWKRATPMVSSSTRPK